MTFNIKKLIIILAIVTLGVSVVGCSSNDKEENIKYIISEENALEKCKEKLDGILTTEFLELGTDEYGLDKIVSYNDKTYYGIYYVNGGIVGDFRFLVEQSKGDIFYDAIPGSNNLIPIDEYIDMEESETIEQISEEEALRICKEKLEGIWTTEFLELGTDEYGLEKIVSCDDKTYYGIYYVNDGIVGDFRFLVDSSTGEVFYDTTPILENLKPIDEYISEFEN